MDIHMFKHQVYDDRVIKSLNFENKIYKEFQDMCISERIYPSQKIQQLMVAVLESKKKELITAK